MDEDVGLAEDHLKTIQMLHDVLGGEPCASVSARAGLSRSVIERRVKALAVQLTQGVGVDGLRVEGATFVRRLRLNRDAVLAALVQYEPTIQPLQRAARVLSPAEVELAALRVKSRSSRPNHDLALFHLVFATGLRPLEVARLEVVDYVLKDGSVRRQSKVRPEVAINGKGRPLFFSHRRLDEALTAYLDDRLQAGHRLGTPSVWRGLDPASRLLLTAAGEPYEISSNDRGGRNRHVCRTLLETYRKIFRHAGAEGLSTQSARLTLMSRMYERGADEDQVGTVLGIADRSAVREQLPRPKPQLCEILDELA